MNARGRSLRLGSTRYADASGANPATVSTAGDQFRLTLRALQIPAFRQIVAMPRVMLPVAGPAYNVNSALGHDGIVGVKTGSSSQAGDCLAFAAIRTVAGSPVTIVGVVLGVRATAARPSAPGGVIAASENLLGSIGRDLEHAQVIRPGAVGVMAAHPAMIRPGALSSPRAWLPGVVPGVPREPAGHWDRQVTCPGPARFARRTRRCPGRRPAAGSPAPGSLAPGRSQPGAGPAVTMIPGGTGPAAGKRVRRGCHGFRRS
jgi:hypothetical protein